MRELAKQRDDCDMKSLVPVGLIPEVKPLFMILYMRLLYLLCIEVPLIVLVCGIKDLVFISSDNETKQSKI